MKKNQTQASYSCLKLVISEQLNLDLDSELPAIIYRDFGKKDDRDNFIKGNIWFSSPNQNRFFAADHRKDEYECRNNIGTFLHSYSLSFSIERPLNNNAAIMIRDVKGFILAIKMDLEQRTTDKSHMVTWLQLDKLQERASRILPVVCTIKKFPTRDDGFVELPVQTIGGRLLKYEDKLKTINNIKDLILIPNNAYNKTVDKINEKEFRIWLNTADFALPYSGSLHNLVEYLKLSTPNISNFCEPIN